jgi:endonuclease/exonuclease/phosphatase family metal-dependent hydrolase
MPDRRSLVRALLWLAAVSTTACVANDGAPARAGEELHSAQNVATPGPGTPLRIMAANTTSGNNQSYDPGDGARMFEGLAPDVVLIQEFNVGANTDVAVRSFVDATFGPSFAVFREQGALPNGVISRYPIADSGSWTDPRVANRGFAWAKIAVPGPHPLWAVSLHLLTTSVANRAGEATALVSVIQATVPAADYLVVGGDLNTGTRAETCISSLTQVVTTAPPYPDDGHGNANTSGTRSKPHDWVMPDADLLALRVPTRIGAQAFPNGLVFDSRVYSPLSDVPPVQASDSAASNMQHMPVVEDFLLPN